MGQKLLLLTPNDPLSRLTTTSSDIRDVHDILEVTVYDEDKDHKYEFLGKVTCKVLNSM